LNESNGKGAKVWSKSEDLPSLKKNNAFGIKAKFRGMVFMYLSFVSIPFYSQPLNEAKNVKG
jgi:hypothetical protein